MSKPRGFYTRGKGTNRKVIPINGTQKKKESTGRPKATIRVAGWNLTRQSQRDFLDTVKYGSIVLDDAEDLIGMAYGGLSPEDFEVYPGLRDVKQPLETSRVLLKNAMLNLGLIPKKNIEAAGDIVRAVSGEVQDAIKILYLTSRHLDDVLSEYWNNPSPGRDRRIDPAFTSEGYSLESRLTDLIETEAELRKFRDSLLHGFRDLRKEQYMEAVPRTGKRGNHATNVPPLP